MSDKHPQCCRTRYRDWRQQRCRYRGVIQRDGKWYCRIHDPEAVARRVDKSERQFTEKTEAKKRAAAVANQGLIDEATADLRRQLDAEKAKVKRLREACKGAVETIKDWHGPAAWDIYLNHAPEMRLITAALAETEKTT
ncbi:MAG TPA: hypothetical protein VM223_00220 [Planctomycetota bacterium]|nr:hypothetical protein [Planctomycetota bacterium]